MPRRYTRHSPHRPPGFASTVELARETGFDPDRVRRIARRNGLLVQVVNDLFIDRAAFLALLAPRPVPPLPASSPDTDQAA
jgi:hypothetical protein